MNLENHLYLHPDLNQVLELEAEICELISQTSQCFTHFEYEATGDKNMINDDDSDDEDKGTYYVTIITYNPYHGQVFTLKTFQSTNRVKGLNKALKYLKEDMKTENNYTVKWTNLNSDQEFRSYFRGLTEADVKAKFYCSVDNLNKIKLKSIQLSPIC